ncbi:MAG: hypothetical protein ABJN84_02385 [Flavobacteriaceae bacterium]
MNIRINPLLVLMLISTALSSFTEPNLKLTAESMITSEQVDGARIYQNSHNQFKYYIASIGTVSIDNVELNNDELLAFYSYKLGKEVRNVVSALKLDEDGIYKGTCTTKVNGKVLFAVNTWLTFSEDGTATGNWCWSGNPSKNDPIVTISKS